MSGWLAFAPELALFGSALFFLALSMVKRADPRRDFSAAALLALFSVAVALAAIAAKGTLFAGAYEVDLFSQVIKVLLAVGLLLVICLCSRLEGVSPQLHPEFYMLLFTCTLAMMLLSSAVHLLSAYVALELSSYSLYVLVAMRRTRQEAAAAALNFFIVGILSSAVMLFGIALLYGATGAATLAGLRQAFAAGPESPLAVVGLLLALSGFFFKLAVFPFHIWAADTYQGAAHQVTAYIATASKIGAVAILLRTVAAGSGNTYIVHALIALSVLSMTVGNLAAIAQKDLKRLFAYSSIAQAGYILIGVLSMSPAGSAAAIFYALALLLMKFTCFLVLVLVAADGADLDVAGLAGLHRRAPVLALALMMSVFSLAGIPPTIGFTGKFLLFNAAIERGMLPLALIAMANVVVSLYYYLMVVKAAYLDEPASEPPRLEVPRAANLLAGTMVALVIAVGIFPTWFLELSRAAAAVLVK